MQDDKSKSRKIATGYDLALAKLQKYCVYQDRCHSEVRTKLLQLQVYGDDLENIITDLIQDDFLNEERFACSFVRGKYRMKKWGRDKILIELKRKGISAYCIKKGMEEIEDFEYRANLESLQSKLLNQYEKYPPFEQRQKIYASLRRKGYTHEEILSVRDNG